MLQQEIVNTYEMNIENFSIEIEYIERNQLEILELKNRVTKTSKQIWKKTNSHWTDLRTEWKCQMESVNLKIDQ